MNVSKNILLCLVLVSLFTSCRKHELLKTDLYNQNANDLLFQIIEENKCNCLFEISTQSTIEISTVENPNYDIRGFARKELRVNDSELDSLTNISNSFKLDIEKTKREDLKIFTLENILAIKNGKDNQNLEMCPRGIICFQKPIFDKTFKKAILDYNYAFTCLKILPPPIYELKDGKWKNQSDSK